MKGKNSQKHLGAVQHFVDIDKHFTAAYVLDIVLSVTDATGAGEYTITETPDGLSTTFSGRPCVYQAMRVTTVPAKALAKCSKLKAVKIWNGELTKKQLTDPLKGSKVTTIKLCSKAAKAKAASYARWAKAVLFAVKVKNA